MGDLDWVSASQLQLGSALANAGENWQTSGLSVTLSSQLSNLRKKEKKKFRKLLFRVVHTGVFWTQVLLLLPTISHSLAAQRRQPVLRSKTLLDDSPPSAHLFQQVHKLRQKKKGHVLNILNSYCIRIWSIFNKWGLSIVTGFTFPF